ATSNYDVNTFSKINNGDDRGWAARLQFNSSKPLHSKNNLELNTLVDYEYVQDKFKPLERLRSVEFSRDWGLPILLTPATENLIRLGAGLKNTRNTLSYRFTNYTRSDNYKGSQHILTQVANLHGWLFNNDFTITNFN